MNFGPIKLRQFPSWINFSFKSKFQLLDIKLEIENINLTQRDLQIQLNAIKIIVSEWVQKKKILLELLAKLKREIPHLNPVTK